MAESIALAALDELSVEVISDDVSDTYVSKTPFAASEIDNVVKGGATVISGNSLLVANLGYGLRLRSTLAATEHVMLFDTGTEAAAFLRNCANLNLDLGTVEEIAITHGHWDHMGALIAAIDSVVAARGSVTVHVNPGMFNQRGVKLANGEVVPVENVPTPDEMRAHGAVVLNDSEARLLLDGHFYYSAEIPRLTSFEKGRTDHLCRPVDGSGPWEPDPLLLDERMLVAHVRGLGLIVFSACSHAGIVNVCTRSPGPIPRRSDPCGRGRPAPRRSDGSDHPRYRRRSGAVRHSLPDLRPLHRVARGARTRKRIR